MHIHHVDFHDSVIVIQFSISNLLYI